MIFYNDLKLLAEVHDMCTNMFDLGLISPTNMNKTGNDKQNKPPQA